MLLGVVAEGVSGRGEDDAADVAEHRAGQPGPLGQARGQGIAFTTRVTQVGGLQELVRIFFLVEHVTYQIILEF